MRKPQFKWLILIQLFFGRVSLFEVGKVSSGTGAGIWVGRMAFDRVFDCAIKREEKTEEFRWLYGRKYG